jgi:cytochrome b involved in lipid metabolism
MRAGVHGSPRYTGKRGTTPESPQAVDPKRTQYLRRESLCDPHARDSQWRLLWADPHHIGCKFTMALTRQEINQHNSRQSCWVVIHGAVYDVTGEVLPSVKCSRLTL